MRVLIVEGTPGAGVDARRALTDAGHDLAECHPQGPSVPCSGIGGGPGCPLETGGSVDVVVLAADGAFPGPTASEDGVRCALRRHVPLALTGAVDTSPYLEHATEVSPGFDDVVGAAERAALRPLAAHAEVARGALKAVLEGEGLDPSAADATVIRNRTMLTVALNPGIPVDSRILDTASVRALAAVRALDQTAAIIDVTVVNTPSAAATT